MFNLGVPEIVLILGVALLVFGPKRLPELGKGLGTSLREFKAALSPGSTEDPTSPPETTPSNQEAL